MTDDPLPPESAEELFEEAPCGYLSTQLDGTIVRVNRTFERWTGRRRDDLVHRRRFQELLSPGDRIYHETHFAPLLQMQGRVREIAVDVVREDGSLLPTLVNAVVHDAPGAHGRVVRMTIFDATDRRRYEQELVRTRTREREIAQELQRSLLAGHLPESPRLQLDVLYRAAERLDAGGDWFDAYWIEEDVSIDLVVGDVVGRGIPAAATMGQLRSAIRALATTGLEPAELIETLDAYARRHRVGQMTTLVYARVELQAERIRFACAGHLPPLLVPAEGEPRFLWDGRSLPLDPLGNPVARIEAVHDFKPGATLILYTDGLVERRTQSLDEGMDMLLDAVAALPGASAGVIARAVEESLPRHDSDDLCLLVARRSG